MASTRSTTGNSKPRVVATISTEPARKRTTTKKRGTTKANTSKPRSTAGVKKRAPASHHKRKPSIKDKIEGATEKIIGKIEGKPGKEAAGTKKMRGTDGKGARGRKAVV